MTRAGTGMKVARALLLLGVGWLDFLSGTKAQTCTSGSKAVAIFAGVMHSCALLDDATVKCWGINDAGFLGKEMGTNLASVDLGAAAVADDATVKCWGENIYGLMGLGDTANRGDGANAAATD
ncbi:hypothetical protein T484DRAFT_1809166 [Baffinella frigidus]|nr:hypothetical protein T484DRAFT_1809166 [Cryptophyta sp. CCMP2293]